MPKNLAGGESRLMHESWKAVWLILGIPSGVAVAIRIVTSPEDKWIRYNILRIVIFSAVTFIVGCLAWPLTLGLEIYYVSREKSRVKDLANLAFATLMLLGRALLVILGVVYDRLKRLLDSSASAAASPTS